jgi:hypothetical protein
MGGACEPEAPPPPQLPVEEFAISYERSGGFAAMPQKLTIRPGRQATAVAVDPAGKRRSVQFRVAAKKIVQLRAAAEAAEIGAIAPEVPGTCADCFVYVVRYRSESVSLSQVSVPARMQGLITRLETLVTAHLPLH